MRLAVTLERASTGPVDLVVTLDGNARVEDLAQELLQADPSRPSPASEQLTLQITGSSSRTLAPETLVLESGLRNGDHVSLTPAPQRFADKAVNAIATLRVVAGPDIGQTFPLEMGTHMIGREADCEVRLTDTSVSRRHAKLLVGEVVEVVDAGSSNGIFVGDAPVERARLDGGVRVRLGDSEIEVQIHPASSRVARGSVDPSIAFNRSPLVQPVYEGPTLVVPDPPQKQQTSRFPVIALAAPLVFGSVLFLITGSLLSIIFVALSPVMMIGNFLEQRWSAKRGYQAAVESFTKELSDLAEQGKAAAAEEIARRRVEHPATNDVINASNALAPLLWSRRPSDDRFLQVRLGLATSASRTIVKIPSARQCEPDLWQQILDLRKSLATVPGVPIVADLAEHPLGLAGPVASSSEAVRSVLAQLTGLHSPAEVVVAAFLDPRTLPDYAWLLWLPHTSSPFSPLTARHLASTPSTIPPLLTELEDLIDRRADGGEAETGPAIVVLVQDAATFDRSRMVALSEAGTAVGVHVVWHAPRVSDLPATCRTFLEVLPDSEAGGVVGLVNVGLTRGPVVSEAASVEALMGLARGLSPVVDSGAPLEDASDLPRSVSWVAMHGSHEVLDPPRVIERWRQSRSIMTGQYASPPSQRNKGSLRAYVGERATEPHVLDLRTHGPHALVGGTTGSGKSEFLQSWILGMASAHSPDRVTFLLVDYKGGSAFKDCKHLPHTVGLVTDLGKHMVRRALTSLSAELRYREHLLAEHGKKDLIELEETGHPATPPSLVIVVDEFAALVEEVPEFVEGVVNVAQRGRSLGLHLILATQQPSGVIKGNLRANTNLRVALRMADADDSTDVLGSPVAGSFDPDIPGRGMSKTGPGRLVAFQSGFAGGWTSDTPPPPQILVEELTLGEPRRWERPEPDEQAEVIDPGEKDISRVVATVRKAAQDAALPLPRKPWLPELFDTYVLERLPSPRTDATLVFGVRDDPDNQQQPVSAFYPDVDGNLIVYGTGGSGKSGLLRALAIDAGFTKSGGPCHVYAVDFGARGLDMLEPLPHVGSVIRGSDDERLTRLLNKLRAIIDDRAARFMKAKAGSIVEYRRLVEEHREEPRILLIIDGVPAFRAAYESGAQSRWWDLFLSIASDGRPHGVHVIMSADRPASVPGALAATVQRRIVLRLADPDDYSLVSEPNDVLRASSPPGRGMEDGAEIQVAAPAGSRNVLEQARQIERIADILRAGGTSEAPAIQVLPALVHRSMLPAAVDAAPVLGWASASLSAIALPDRGSFLIAGPEGSGRTTALLSSIEGVRACWPDAQLHYVGQRRSELYALPFWRTRSGGPDEQTAQEAAVRALLGEPTSGRHVVVLESVTELAGSSSAMDNPVVDLVKGALEADCLVLADGDSTALGQTSLGLVGLAKSSRAGIALQPEQGDGTSLFKTEFPRVKRSDFPEGRGLMARRGRAEVVQVAWPGPDFQLKGSSPHSQGVG